MSEYADAKNYFQRLVNFSSASVYKDMLHHAIAAFDRAEKAEAEVERLKGALQRLKNHTAIKSVVFVKHSEGQQVPISALSLIAEALEAKP